MKIELKDFQEIAVKELIKQVMYAKNEIRQGGAPQAVVLSSPTGSGKTVISAALMEAVLEGTDHFLAEEEAVFLWLSDQPELNKQSRKKILDSSDRIRESDIVIIDSDFDQETLDAGKLYFVNTQKLGRDKLLTIKGDKRFFTIWETINNTQLRFGEKFYLIIDEAHRGMNQNTREENFTKTIVQKFIYGSPEDGLLPIRLIIGISATPGRFLTLIQSTQHQQNRILREVTIDPEEVRTSGLLKDKIILHHPKEGQPSDWTLLATAARQWLLMRDSWNEYTKSQGIGPVNPVMVIQVEDRSEDSVTRTDLEMVIKTLEEEIGPIKEEEIRHCFEEDFDIPVGNRRIRKIDASQIQETTDVKFVLFKLSLTTGWDCPRAEVMMSFRRAQDFTLIAQLIGRMVRTPLARKVERNELLNTVSLYLPYYNKEGLRQVIEFLKSDPDIVPPTEPEDGNNLVILTRRQNSEALFRALEEIPTYYIEKTKKMSNLRRLMKLSRLLTSFHGIDPEAYEESKKLILETLHSEKELLKASDPDFSTQVDEADEIVVYPVTVEQGIWTEIPGDPVRVKLTEANISELFNRCGKRLGDGLHLEYWSTYYDSEDPNRPKLELFLTLQNQEIFEKLEQVCDDRINTLFEKHKIAIRSLSSSEEERYNKIKIMAKDPQHIHFSAPPSIMVNVDKSDPKFAYYDKHLYVDNDNNFPAVFNSWEKSTIVDEIEKEEVVAWLRNYDRKPWALCVPYKDGDEIKSFYPDFLIVRKDGDNYIIDVLEPHREDYDDNWKKAVGLAEFAKNHWNSFGRIEIIRKKGSALKRLNLNNETVRRAVARVNDNEHLDTIFDTLSD
ncbi:DEAD/DEAH box helicase [Paenibacillus thermoaerophilus]|uniref:DEAD/DEAH box helicase n=1 Tax=Paenibacillus thermoaerophilus TaxID=1215385 RepID=A0ABW2V852_9BACL|nr:DEAD/DEAH box helicase family protein [Paenibacillus thermoaerophilus]